MDSSGARGKRIAVLDGWRGVSILGVVAAHTLNLRFGSLIRRTWAWPPRSGPLASTCFLW
jgi:peptidoglycan/LPS O-acetylase OafA/YrhL